MTPPKLFGREMVCKQNSDWYQMAVGCLTVEIHEVAMGGDSYRASVGWGGHIVITADYITATLVGFGGVGSSLPSVLSAIESWLMDHMLGLTNALGFELRRTRT